jgi:RNA polymerase sigma-70 factor (ECF subfamily)
VGDPHAAEDLASDVFLSALTALPRFRHRSVPVRAWLYRIATNGANRWARRRRRQAVRDWEAVSAAVRSAGLAPASEPAVTSDMARSAMLTLKPRHQTVLTLHYLEGLSIEQIGLALGCSEGTVKSRLARGRDALRERLKERRTQP